MNKPKPVKLSWLIRSKRLSPMSPTALISEKLGIKWLPLFNDEYVYGPTPGIIEAADLLMAELKPRIVVDLFGGSGAISKLAILRGARKVIYVDKNPEAALLNLRSCKGKVEIIEGDAFTFLNNKVQCDFMVADPPEELISNLLNKLKLVRKSITKAALIWLGPSEKAIEYLEIVGKSRMTMTANVWGDTFLIIWKPGFGQIIRDVKRRLE